MILLNDVKIEPTLFLDGTSQVWHLSKDLLASLEREPLHVVSWEVNTDWSKQHCGVHHAPVHVVRELMPDLGDILGTFPDNPKDFTWDVKVHMLMPRQYPCIPNWHVDNVPRVNGIQRFDRVRLDLPMYCWISGPPLTQFKHGYLSPGKWLRFTQADEHRGTAASEFCWRGFIRATHKGIMEPKAEGHLRRHCQVYLDAETYQW